MKKVLSFDIGGTNTRLALINERFEIEKELVTPTPSHDAEKFVENCLKMIEEFPLENVIGIGAGVPGVVDREKGIILDLPNVFVKDINFAEKIYEKFHLPLYLRNDAEVACLGEAYLGEGKGYERVVFITISTGLGGALCVDQKCQDYVTEVGHTLFPYKNGYYEYSIISGIEIPNFAKLHGMNFTSARGLFEAYKNGDKNALFLRDEWISVLNKFVRLMNDSYSPDIIVMTGGFMKNKEVFFPQIIEENPDILIKECKFSDKAGLMGAAVYALQCAKII